MYLFKSSRKTKVLWLFCILSLAKDNIQNNHKTLVFLDDLNKYIETIEKKIQKYTI